MTDMKRVFGLFEVVFDTVYLGTALLAGGILLLAAQADTPRLMAGVMALTLGFGDAFHLIPRMKVVLTGQEEILRPALGRGKQITSVTMTIFYLILWQIGLLLYHPAHVTFWTWLLYALSAVRILLCLLPQNQWQNRYPPVRWGIWRNIPFFLSGAMVAVLFFLYRSAVPGFGLMWAAIALSFAFYLPVVLWSNRHPAIGMLMLPKTCAYVWMLFLCLSL